MYLYAMTELEFEKVFNSMYSDVLWFIYRRVSSYQDSDEIASEVFCRLWQHKDNVDSDKILGWLMRTARNCVTDHYRKNNKKDQLPDWPLPEPDDDYEPVDPFDMLHDLCVREDADVVLEFMDNYLTDHEHAVIHMYFGCDKNGTHIAYEINSTPNAVQQCKRRALKKLRGLFFGGI
jgi:RNA polymerase sigma factor (sigma-70 family)